MKSIQDEVMSCEAFVELVTEYLDEALPLGQRARLEQHLYFCEGCVTYLEQVRETSRLVRRSGSEAEPSPAALDALVTVFHRWRQSQDP